MSDGSRRRWKDMGLLLLALAGIFGSITLWAFQSDRQADDAAEQSAAQAEELEANKQRDDVQSRLVAQNALLIEQLAALEAERAGDQAAFNMKVCLEGNDAKRVDRENDRLIVEGMLDIFRQSPHSAPTVAQIEATILPKLSTDADDHDCSGNGTLGPEDYPPPGD